MVILELFGLLGVGGMVGGLTFMVINAVGEK